MYLNGSKAVTTGSALTFDGTNLGLGVTPSAWSVFKAFDINTVGSVAASTTSMSLFRNAYYNGSNFLYKTTDTAERYYLGGGQHQWFTATSGTAGNAISFTQAMTAGLVWGQQRP
jgi:hypothetical protein